MMGERMGMVWLPKGPLTWTARCAAGEEAGREGEMDRGGRVTVTPAGMLMGVEPMCEAHREVE